MTTIYNDYKADISDRNPDLYTNLKIAIISDKIPTTCTALSNPGIVGYNISVTIERCTIAVDWVSRVRELSESGTSNHGSSNRR
jgi:hypothetical protein